MPSIIKSLVLGLGWLTWIGVACGAEPSGQERAEAAGHVLIGADPAQTGSLGILGVNPSLDLDEPALKAIADATGGRYFRARDGDELLKIKQTLDQLEPVAQQPTQARPALALYSAPLALALVLSLLLVIQERWPNNALQRAWHKLSTKGNFLQQHPEWRQRLKRLRLRRRR